MRVAILGGVPNCHDEGMGNTAFYLAKELSNYHEVLPLELNMSSIFSKNFWKNIKDFAPQIIHYVPGPSLKSLIAVKMFKSYCSNAKTVISATHPYFPHLSKMLIPLFKPDLMLVQSFETEKMFTELGCKTKFLPSGVDTEKFVSVSSSEKEKLREKYVLDKHKFVILHVGSIKKQRGLQVFNKIKGEEYQVIVAGSTSTGMERDIYYKLKERGHLIWLKYFENLEEIYALSDCYIFPAPPENKLSSIELPLSVLEAMSCNLPVICTKFGALTRAFREGDGLIFIEKGEDFIYEVEKIKKSNHEIKTREKVLPYSWSIIAKELKETYNDVVSD